MIRFVLTFSLAAAAFAGPAQEHDHPMPEKLGTVSFPISCKPEVQPEFDRAVALLHSFTYKPAEMAFQHVAQQDPACAIAQWGIAMTHYHQLWDLPPSPADSAAGEKAVKQAGLLERTSDREGELIHAIGLVFQGAAAVPYSERALQYEAAMHQLANRYPKDAEVKIFYALALISNASPADREHRRQKQAAALLEPLYRAFPDHPGIAHYLIHAYDNQELAPRGLAAAKVYAGIAPSAPHALHMPSHIFTRLGLWDDSIASNLAARSAAQQQGDTGEELHAMDYLVYAYLQSGRDQDALQLVQQVEAMQNLNVGTFKIGYAATAIPVRYIVERERWDDAENISNPSQQAQPHVLAVAVWARGLGFARNGHPVEANNESVTLAQLEDELRSSGNIYWANQVGILKREVTAWSAQAAGRPKEAAAMLRAAADDEDAIEKATVTPGPILPAREQLGELLLLQGDPAAASMESKAANANSPGRRRGLHLASSAARPH